MYEVTLTPDEMIVFMNVVRKFRDHFDDYPGSQMLLTDKPSFTAAAQLFLAAAEKASPAPSGEPRGFMGSMQRLDIEIGRTPEGRFAIRAGGAFGILASTAAAYEISLVADQNTIDLLRSIIRKFCDQKDTVAAELESQAELLRTP